LVSAICVDAESWSAALKNRLKWIREEFPDSPIVLLLNYPRQDEQESLQQAGVTEVVSKPFELEDLKSAIIRAVKKQAAANNPNQFAADQP
jgi:CheY-like chemotaxis protein